MRTLVLYSLMTGLLCFSTAAQAARVQNCDKVAHEVTVNNAGEEWKMTLEPGRYFDSFGSMVTFKMKDQDPVAPRWFDDWCIWSGKLKLQRRNSPNNRGRF